jgi:hypothetical protein
VDTYVYEECAVAIWTIMLQIGWPLRPTGRAKKEESALDQMGEVEKKTVLLGEGYSYFSSGYKYNSLKNGPF